MTSTPHTADRSKARRGFTLTELMIVVVIVGVMAAMSAPSFQLAIEQSRADIAAANLRAIWAAERLFWLENHAYATSISDLQNRGLLEPRLLLATDRAAGSNYKKGGYDYKVVVATDGSGFTATAARVDDSGAATYGSFSMDQTGVIDPANKVTIPTWNTFQRKYVSNDITPGFQ